MLSSTSADANATVEVVLLEEVDQVFASVQNACEPSTKSAEMIDGNGECPSELSRIDFETEGSRHQRHDASDEDIGDKARDSGREAGRN